MNHRRLAARTPPLALLVRALTLVLAAGLIWYGLMTVLLAVKVSPHTVNSLSAYRTLYNDLVSVRQSDFTSAVRLIAGLSGLLVFLAFLPLALQDFPRPRLARTDLELDRGERGATVVRPQALERLAEFAARGNPEVSRASGRRGPEELHVDVGIRSPTTVAETLTDVRARIGSELERHDLPGAHITVTLTDYDRSTRRELS